MATVNEELNNADAGNQVAGSKVGRGWGGYLKELAVVAFGVVLGMLVSEVRQSFNDQKRADAAYHGMIDEIAFNHQFLVARLGYYESLKVQIDSVIAIRGRKAPFVPKDLSKWKGVMPPFVQKAAFTAAQSSGVFEHMDYETVKRLNLVYSIQDFFSTNWNVLLQGTFKTDEIPLAEMKILFSEFATFSRELSHAYQQTLTAAKANGYDPKNIVQMN